MTKKGYQKQLPTVPPAASPRPAVPAPRVSAEAEPIAPVVEPVQTFYHDENDETYPLQPAERRSPSTTGTVVALALVGLALLCIANFLLVRSLLDNGPDRPAGVGDASTRTRPDVSYVVSEVLPNGSVVVRQRIRAVQPVELLRLVLPLATGAEGVSASQVDVVADGVAILGPETITDGFASFSFAPATDVRVSYRLTGAVKLSESVPGRALAVVTSLDVRYGPRVERETRVVRASEVLMLACSRSPEETPVPCGEPDGDGRWRVDLTGQRVDDRVVAQLTLG